MLPGVFASPKAVACLRFRASALLLLTSVGFASLDRYVGAEDWPAYRADAARSGQSANKLKFPVVPVWRYEPAQAPRPAWPDPGKETHRIDFDYGHHPVIAGGLVIFGSTADDTVRALDAATGEIKWIFTTDGPVRFAPHVENGLVYVASDDGFLYCLHLVSGTLKWRFRGGLRDDRVIGNDRMISRWPLRAGVLVDEDVAYVVAGMWPSEGIFLYALKADTGEIIWCNDTSGSQFMAQPHRGAYALTGLTPQGYLAASEKVLLVPTGRGLPAQFDRRTGKRLDVNNARMINRRTGKFFKFNDSTLIMRGGAWTTVVEDKGMFLSGSDSRLAGFSLHGRRVPSLDEIKGQPYPLSWIYLDRVVVTAETLFGTTTNKALSGVPGMPLMPDRGRELILAGDVLVAGGKGFLQAYRTDGKKVLDPEIDGEVRGLAVAGGRIVASTLEGTVLGFGVRADAGALKRVADIAATPAPVARTTSADGVQLARYMNERKTTKGYALIVNATDARIAEDIAGQSDLHVIALLKDAGKVAAERRRLLTTTALYGSRVVLHHVEDFAKLPFIRYFANLVVVAGNHDTISGNELYHVLRPCGGVMCFIGTAKIDASQWIKASNIPTAEVGTWQGAPFVTRGKLPGAFDWNSKGKADERVKTPLELLWFGEPGPAKMADRHSRPHTPVPANGRYFVVGRHHVIAVDAYNGTVLWERQVYDAEAQDNPMKQAIPSRSTLKSLYADDENVYANLDGFCVQYDALTGEQKALFGDFRDAETNSLVKPHMFKLTIDEEHSGTVEISKSDKGLKLVLCTVDPMVTGHDAWELFFDFRPARKRFGPYGRGTFQSMVTIGHSIKVSSRERVVPLAVRQGAGAMHPTFTIERELTETGSEITLELPAEEMTTLVGETPRGFGFSATLIANDASLRPVFEYAHLFDRKLARVLNDGWPNLVFGAAGDEAAVASEFRKAVRPLTEAPEASRIWSQRPPSTTSGRLGGAGERIHSITGQRVPKVFQWSYGCRQPIESAAMMITRSGTLGYYDFEDDSGFRNFGGVRPGCGGGLLPALGLLISNESASGCACGYSFQTSVALVPTNRRSNEDWALFYDRFPMEDLKQVTLNMGAPGDRRDAERKLWLGFPRPRIEPSDPHPYYTGVLAMELPVTAESIEGFGPDRVNADRITIQNTKRPWVYASHYRGLKTVRFDLRDKAAWVSRATAEPPTIDGELNDACWQDVQPLKFTSAAPVCMRHDKENLYVGFSQRADLDADGNPVPWKKAVRGDDVDVWNDDAFELYFTDGDYYHPRATPGRTKACVHLGMSASGARYDALFQHTAKKKDTAEDKTWNTQWTAKVKTDADTFSGELAIPWRVLEDAGVKLDAPLHVVAGKHLGNFWGEFWAWRGFRNVALDEGLHEAEQYTVRLHFAEPDDVCAGQRMFDIALQGSVVARDVDIFKEAGGRNRALVKEFRNVSAQRELVLDLRAKTAADTRETVPILSGVEVLKQ